MSDPHALVVHVWRIWSPSGLPWWLFFEIPFVRQVYEQRGCSVHTHRVNEGLQETRIECPHIRIRCKWSILFREPIYRSQKPQEVRTVHSIPPLWSIPVCAFILLVVFDERNIVNRGKHEYILRLRQRLVHNIERASLIKHESRLHKRKRYFVDNEKSIGAHGSVEVGVNERQNHQIGLPRRHISLVSKIHLVDPITADTEIQYSTTFGEQLLQPIRPRVFKPHVVTERKGVPDERDPTVTEPVAQDFSLRGTPQSLGTGRV